MEVGYPLSSSPSKSMSLSKKQSINSQQQPIIYDLVGIIVHSDQANAGDYYSFIKSSQIDDNTLDNDSNHKWYKFNDKEINLNDNTLIEECFGSTFTCTNNNRNLPEERRE